jgi:hypothetical protein
MGIDLVARQRKTVEWRVLMNPNEPGQLSDLPPASSTRLIDFERAVVISLMIYPPRPVLVVSGSKPYPMTVELVPLRYVQRPEYWGIEVVGRTDGGGGLTPMPAITNIPYVVELDLAGCVGTRGVEVIGASATEKISVAGEDNTQFVGSVEDCLFRPMIPPYAHGQALGLTTAGVADDVAPEARQIDLEQYNGSILRVSGRHEGDWIYSATVLEQVEADSVLSIVARQVLAGSPSEGSAADGE